MIKGIDCFIPYIDKETTGHIISQLRQEALVHKIYIMARTGDKVPDMGCVVSRAESLSSSAIIRQIAEQVKTDYFLVMHPRRVDFGYRGVERMYKVARNIAASMVYADHFTEREGKVIAAPVNDLYYGSIRDDFDFGSVMLISTEQFREVVKEFPDSRWKYAGWYEVQLAFTRRKRVAPVFHIREYLYADREVDLRKSGEKQFDYVNPRNRESQIEAEQVCTEHLKRIGAYVAPESISLVNIERADFETEASVIIPVKNRVKTIADAVKSALVQQASFPFNVIVVDNHSTDGTTEVLRMLQEEDSRCILIQPTRNDLGIGGCWSVAVNDERCGRFAVQLDSDDLYSSTNTLQRIVDKFYEERCAMVIGSYTMCNFDLKMLPPGLISHQEWTEENGRNNALRVNGLGAPRAFFTPLLRKIGNFTPKYLFLYKKKK